MKSHMLGLACDDTETKPAYETDKFGRGYGLWKVITSEFEKNLAASLSDDSIEKLLGSKICQFFLISHTGQSVPIAWYVLPPGVDEHGNGKAVSDGNMAVPSIPDFRFQCAVEIISEVEEAGREEGIACRVLWGSTDGGGQNISYSKQLSAYNSSRRPKSDDKDRAFFEQHYKGVFPYFHLFDFTHLAKSLRNALLDNHYL
jgi:hypothetical protein